LGDDGGGCRHHGSGRDPDLFCCGSVITAEHAVAAEGRILELIGNTVRVR
jgi:hypothetical protein